MSELIKFSKGVVFSFCVLVGCLGIIYPAFAQLSLVSTTPSDGAINVDTLATFELVFSATLDTTARFEEPQDFFLGIEIFPSDSVGDPEEIILNSGLDTVTVKNVPLTPNTKFVVLLTGAKSITGEPLDRPYVRTFTTGNSLPGGTVSGSVSFPGGDPGGTAIGLFVQPPFGDEDGDVDAAAVVPLSSSNYAINFVFPGTYFVLAFKDVNQDGSFDFPDDAFGGYDSDSDNIADMITLGEGASLTNIDITVSIPVAITARQNFPTAQTIAQTQAADVLLSAIVGGGISSEGQSPSWNYLFYSANQDTIFSVAGLANLFFVSPIMITDGEGPDLKIPLPKNWIDSDVAADSAEANGGSDFRNMYPDAEVNAFAGVLILPEMGGTILAKRAQTTLRTVWSPTVQLEQVKRFDLLSQNMVSEDSLALWVFFYFSEVASQFMQILLDVETGAPIAGPGAPTTAAANLDASNQAALNWASDAVLVEIGNVTTDLTPDGNATGWGFVYYSAGKDSVHAFFLASSTVTGEESPSKDDVPSLEALPQGWLDTPVVTPIAEANSNNFRNVHPDAFVQAHLSRGLLESEPSRAVWQFIYFSATDTMFIYIDALSGDVVTGIDEAPESTNIPKSFALEQNYPNPFNPETIIRYQLPKNGEVELMIFNLLGKKVRELVDEVQPAGYYEVRWDGTDDLGNLVTSGVYYYRIKSGDIVQTKKMIFLQ
ncbi:MAG: T9SS type A sorting domain-containing protein [bacterium]